MQTLMKDYIYGSGVVGELTAWLLFLGHQNYAYNFFPLLQVSYPPLFLPPFLQRSKEDLSLLTARGLLWL